MSSDGSTAHEGELARGARVGQSPWHVVRRLGHGAFGDVYEVEHDVTHKRGAGKVLKPVGKGPKGDVVRDKTLHAARILAQARHPHLVEVYDAGFLDTDPPRNWVVMELLEGRELSKLLAEEGPLEPERALRYLEQAAAAVALVAEQGIVHRDLKPDNLFVTDRDDAIKVLDFDSAHMPRAQSMVGSIVGTPYYMSPEHYRGKKLDSRADVWALGVIFFEMLTGKRPFQGLNLVELAAAVTIHPLPAPSPPIPPALWDVIVRATEKDRDARYPSIGDMAAHLQKLRRESVSSGAVVTYAETERLSSDQLRIVTSHAETPSGSAGTMPRSSTQQAYAAPPARAPGPRRLGVGIALAVGVAAMVAVIGVIAALSMRPSMTTGDPEPEAATSGAPSAVEPAPSSAAPIAPAATTVEPVATTATTEPSAAPDAPSVPAPPAPPPAATPPAPVPRPGPPSPPPPGPLRW
ncbi:MAG: serine/threonine-protein kinase [Polyangiaceae bacterium]